MARLTALKSAITRRFSQFRQVSVDPGEDVAGDLVPIGLVEQLVAPTRIKDDADLPHAGAAVEGGGALDAPPTGSRSPEARSIGSCAGTAVAWAAVLTALPPATRSRKKLAVHTNPHQGSAT